jgi:hypothetical protein
VSNSIVKTQKQALEISIFQIKIKEKANTENTSRTFLLLQSKLQNS